MALSLLPGCLCAPKFDKNLVRLIWQWKCKCKCKYPGRDKFRSRDLGVCLSRTIMTEKLEKTRANFKLSVAASGAPSVAVAESADVKRATKSWGLNEEQVTAVETNDNYVRVVAGPGSGKTRVLTHRIAHMVTRRDVSPSSVLVGTIHSVCAKVLRCEQVSDYHIDGGYIIYDENESEKVVKRILREAVSYFDAFKASNGKEHLDGDAKSISTQIVDEKAMQRSESDLQKNLARFKFLTGNAPQRFQLLQYLEKHDTGKSEKKRSVPAVAVKGLLNIINKVRLHNMRTFFAKKHQRTLPGIPYRLDEFAFKMAEIYELELRRSNAVDFDDLLYIVARLLHNNQHIQKKYREKWRHVLVDEFQDIDETQYELISLLSIQNESLFVVGDIDQAIYAWRGANAAHMQYTLDRDFPNITTLKLIRNYRSSRNILKVASVLIKKNSLSREIGSTKALDLLPMNPSGEPICIKKLYSSIEEADFVASQIQRLVHTKSAKLSSFAIFYRTHAQSFLLQSSLIKLQIPHVAIGSTPFYSHKEVRHVLAYLRFLGNCQDQTALESIINVPPRGIGEQTLAGLKQWASDKGLTLSSALKCIHGDSISNKELNIRPQARTALLQFWELIEGLQSLIHGETIGTIIEDIIERTDLKSYLNNSENCDKASRKKMNRLLILQQIGDSATQKYGIGKMALATFLQEISLASDQKNVMGEENENCVKLMTLHAAKGLEFDTVFITGLLAGCLPLEDADLDEERRLFYVGITRAIRRLYLTFSTSSFVRGQTREAKPSVFIKELLRSTKLNGVTKFFNQDT